MNRLYEALQKGKGEIADVLPLILEQDQPRPGVPAADQQMRNAVEAVRGVLEEPQSSIPVEPLPEVVTPLWDGNIRRLRLHIPAGSPLLPFDDTNFRAAEQYRMIRTRLIQHIKQPRLILISSAGPGDGKSVTAVNIAGALSLKTEAKVLLADTDFRRSTIHTQLGLSASPGLADVLAGSVSLEDAVIRIEEFPNLYIVSAGEPCINPSELLDSTRWREVCDRLRTTFRYIIADCPPVASVADYELLQATCDGVVLVMRPDHTKRQACLQALGMVPKEKLIGIVMNCVEDWFLARREAYTPPAYYYGRTAGERK